MKFILTSSAAVARRNCNADVTGQLFMILADVIIGTVAKGGQSLTCPPTNLATNTQYDTTVDDINAPTMFVKYDKAHYYPHYIIQFY